VHRLILATVLLLSGCVAGGRQVAGFRHPEAPIWSAAAFAPGQIAGDWRQVAAFSAKAGGCGAGGLTFVPAAGGLAVRGTLCLDGTARAVDALARPLGSGRFAVDGQEDWWVLWVDSGYRTLAIGTPSGRFGFVLDRAATPPDRLRAVQEVFDFNGYVTPALRAF
jgi:apolipoprotein D and lipocalin family protein